MTLDHGHPPERRRFVHARRFAIAYALLALALAAAGALLYAAFEVESERDERWSTWAPAQEEGIFRLREIARHVAMRYSDGAQRLPFQPVPGPPQARVRSGAGGEAEEIPLDFAVVTGRSSDAVPLNTAVSYGICGRGQNCALTADAVQREFGVTMNGVLELALYTFKYVPDIESALFFLPPIPGAGEEAGSDGLLDTVVFLERKDLDEQLDKPITATPLHTSGAIGTSVRQLIRPHLYTYSYDATGQGTSLLRLTPYGSETGG
jgi:hypothetical protein